MKKSKRQLELAKEYKSVILYMLNNNPSSEYWNSQLEQINDLIRKLK